MRGFVNCYDKFGNLAARKDSINNVEETFTYDNYIQDPTSQQGFNRYAYCFYNPLKYIDPSGEACYGPSQAEMIQQAINEAKRKCWDELYRYNEELESTYQSVKNSPSLWGQDKGGMGHYNTTSSVGNSTRGTNGRSGTNSNGGYYNSNGRYLGSNGKNDGKVYIICDAQLSRREYRATVRFIKENSGNADAFTDDCIASRNSIEIASYENRQAMWEIVRQDNGKGGIADCNNREYGGYIDVDGVHEMPAGDVGNPNPIYNNSPGIYLPNGYSRFHSHPSGDYYEYNHLSGLSNSHYEFVQNLSQADLNNAKQYGNENFTHYVFGRSNDCVYIYNHAGLQAIMKTNIFLKLMP